MASGYDAKKEKSPKHSRIFHPNLFPLCGQEVGELDTVQEETELADTPPGPTPAVLLIQDLG